MQICMAKAEASNYSDGVSHPSIHYSFIHREQVGVSKGGNILKIIFLKKVEIDTKF